MTKINLILYTNLYSLENIKSYNLNINIFHLLFINIYKLIYFSSSSIELIQIKKHYFIA